MVALWLVYSCSIAGLWKLYTSCREILYKPYRRPTEIGEILQVLNVNAEDFDQFQQDCHKQPEQIDENQCEEERADRDALRNYCTMRRALYVVGVYECGAVLVCYVLNSLCQAKKSIQFIYSN